MQDRGQQSKDRVMPTPYLPTFSPPGKPVPPRGQSWGQGCGPSHVWQPPQLAGTNS